MNIAGGVLMGNDANMWTWKSPSGEYQRKDYILHSRSLRSDDTSSNLELDMDSDHRNVSTSIEIMSSQQNWKMRKRTFKGWKPTLDSSRKPSNYHSHLTRLMDECPPDNLQDLGKIAIQAAIPAGEAFQGPNGVSRPGRSLILKDLVFQRKEARDTQRRRDLSKSILKQARRELRMWKSKWAEHLVQKFENTKYLQKIRSAPIRSSACAIDAEEFASFLGTLYSSANPLAITDEDKKMIQSIFIFSLQEFDSALKTMSNLRSTDEDGMVVEMIKYANIEFKESLIIFFNKILIDGTFDESWHNTILQMLPKDGDLKELFNWRPIALLQIFYKIFSKFVYNRISTHLFQRQSLDQHGFTPDIRIEDALLCAEVVIEHHQEFQIPLWMLSMDMRKAFDTIDHPALIRALRSRGLPEVYVALLFLLYANQMTSVDGSSKFSVQRRDTFGALLFNCVVDVAFDD